MLKCVIGTIIMPESNLPSPVDFHLMRKYIDELFSQKILTQRHNNAAYEDRVKDIRLPIYISLKTSLPRSMALSK
jgi:hypothetical protein